MYDIFENSSSIPPLRRHVAWHRGMWPLENQMSQPLTHHDRWWNAFSFWCYNFKLVRGWVLLHFWSAQHIALVLFWLPKL